MAPFGLTQVLSLSKIYNRMTCMTLFYFPRPCSLVVLFTHLVLQHEACNFGHRALFPFVVLVIRATGVPGFVCILLCG